MEFLKSLFSDGPLDYDGFAARVTAKGYKLADLSTGKYVDSKKFKDEISSRDTTITDLTNQISTRDTDISALKKQIEDGGIDSETKLAELNSQLTKLQGDYETAKNDYEGRLSKQSYEFAVKEFANSKKFSSNAAKRDFINEMISAGLKMKNDTILGAEDFVGEYTKANEDAFIMESPAPVEPEAPKPTFGQPTPPQPAQNDNAFISAFNFAGIRPHNN